MVWEASRRRIGELKVNGTVWPMECRLVVIDIEFPWTDNRRVTNGRDAIRESMEFGHPLVGIILFRTKGLRSASLSRPLCFPTPLKTRIPATSVYYPFVRKFYSFLLYDFDDVEGICINSKII